MNYHRSAVGWLACLIGFGPLASLQAAVSIVTGPTAIVDGEARAAGDITVFNEKLAFALAVQSAVPYGVPRGAIIDVAAVVNGKIGRDHVVFADFVPNNWSAWPNTYQHVDVLERGPERVVITATRDWGKVTIATTYTLRANADQIDIQTTMTNNGDMPLTDLLSGLTLWPKGGFLFGVPGLAQMEHGRADGALSDRVVAYDADWSLALHAPYFNAVSSGSKDMLQLHTLKAGEARTFGGSLQVGSRGDLGPVVAAEIERKHLAAAVVSGSVMQGDGKRVAEPVVVVEKDGMPFAWVLGSNGRYSIKLPEGRYSLYATAKRFSQSQAVAMNLVAGAQQSHDFRDLQGPGRIRIAVVDALKHRAIDARITITAGQKPLVEFLGRKTFFTELDSKGIATLNLAPGSYVFSVVSGGGFLTPGRELKLLVRPGKTLMRNIGLTPRFNPAAQGWYSADLHHHADQAEAVTPPPDLARSQLAAGLDVLFVSDHDSTVNHSALQRIANRRGMPFLASMEISPSWGHFNAYPLRHGLKLAIDPSVANIDAVLAEASRQGAIVIQSNHPFIPYGYFASLEAGVAPGGFNPRFDLLEINATAPEDDEKVLRQLASFWNAGHHYYLTAGTDTHDVWKDESGRVRSFAYVDGRLTPQSFAQAMKAGHSYVSFGPLIFPSILFGDEIKVKAGEPFALNFELKSLAGIKHATLVSGGGIVRSESFADSPQETRIDYSLQTDRATWYALRVEDQAGKKAYTNPIWVDVVSLVPRSGELR